MYRVYDIDPGYISRKRFKKDYESFEKALEAIKENNYPDFQYVIAKMSENYTDRDRIVAFVSGKNGYKPYMVD